MGRRVIAVGASALLLSLALAAIALGWASVGPRPAAPVLLAGSPAGAMRIASSDSGRAILRASALAPGQAVSGGLVIRNSGKQQGTVELSRRNLADAPGLGGGILSGALELTVLDVTGGSDGTVWAGLLSTMPKLRLALLDPGKSRRYEFRATLSELVLPDLAGAGTSFDYRWKLTSAAPKHCALKFRGDAGANRIVGSAGSDRIIGLAGRDKLIGGEGDDCIKGGPGKDLVDCGPGEDTATVDRLDAVRACEHVVRRG